MGHAKDKVDPNAIQPPSVHAGKDKASARVAPTIAREKMLERIDNRLSFVSRSSQSGIGLKECTAIDLWL